MSGRFVRASKFRHVHGEPTRKDHCYTGYTRVLTKGEGQGIAANGSFIAVPMQGGGGPVAVINRDTPGRAGLNMPVLNVHSGDVTDMEFSPFLPNVIATGSEDCRVAVTVLPEGGLTENHSQSAGTSTVFAGHQKKIVNVNFHPTANVLASSGADNVVKVWDLIAAEEAYSFDEHPGNVADIKWNADGSLLGTTCKDHKMRIFDPRTAGSVQETESFSGPKASKLFWVPNLNQVGAVGADSRSKRQIGLWDPRNFSEPVTRFDLDQAAGILLPHFDPDTSMLYLAGKGDASINYFEITEDGPRIHHLSMYRDSESTKGACFLPKRFCDVSKCEVAVGFRLLRDYIMPISFQVPRKSDMFQADLYPDTYAGVPSLTPDDYKAGKNAEPTKVSMKPGAAAAAGPSNAAAAMPTKSRAQLQEELDAANKTIEELRAEIAQLKA